MSFKEPIASMSTSDALHAGAVVQVPDPPREADVLAATGIGLPGRQAQPAPSASKQGDRTGSEFPNSVTSGTDDEALAVGLADDACCADHDRRRSRTADATIGLPR